MSQSNVRLRSPLKAAFLAWLIPGWGHLYQGRKGKAILYATCILGLYFMGLVMGEGKIVYWRWVSPFDKPEKFCIYYVGQFWVGLAALPALIQSTLQHYGFEPILWNFLAEPSQIDLNGLHPRLGKLVEIGTIYTTIAGLLNILAIYDAYEGPAYQEFEEHSVSTFPAGALARRNSKRKDAIMTASAQVYWLILPLVAAISIVYSASRHESWRANLVALDPTGALDPRALGRRDSDFAVDQHAGLNVLAHSALVVSNRAPEPRCRLRRREEPCTECSVLRPGAGAGRSRQCRSAES